MAVVRWRDPFLWGLGPQLDRFERTLSELNREFLAGLGELGPAIREGRDQVFTAPVDISERDGDLVVRAELPGIDPDKDLDVSLDNGVLWIKGERHREERDERENYIRVERSFGSFRRGIPLPDGVTQDDINATYRDGVLEVVAAGAAKKPEAAKITVQTAPAVESADSGASEESSD